jgi:serine/threonine protein kinase
LAAFLKEAQILALLQHPNVVHLYGLYSSSADDKFMVVEFLNKGNA